MKPYYDDGKGIILYNADWRLCEFPVDGSFSLLCVDPPYGIGESKKNFMSRGKPFGSRATNSRAKQLAYGKDYGYSEWDDATPTPSDILWMRSLAKHQIIFGGNYFNLPPSKCWLVWDKVNGASDFADCELAWTNFDKAVRMFRYMWNGMLREGDDVRVHPTQKPRALISWCLAQAPKDITSVIDPYAGSGTTLVVAKAVGLSAVGCEIEERYCESAAIRLSQSVFDFGEVPETLPVPDVITLE